MSKSATARQPAALISLPTMTLLGAVLFWGSSFPAMKAALRVLDPWSIMWLRLTVGSLILTPVLGRIVQPRVILNRWKLFLPLAALQPCLYFLLESYALKYTTSAQAGIVAACLPIMVAVGARVFLAERISPRAYAGLLLSVLGVVWLTLAGTPSGDAPNPLLGNLLELGAMACASGSILIIKHLSEQFGPWTITAVQTLAGAIFFLPGIGPLLHVPAADLASVLPVAAYLGSCVTLGAFGLYNIGVARIPASRASVFINLVPVVAVFFAWLFLGETLNPMQLLAAGCIFLGVWVTQKSA